LSLTDGKVPEDRGMGGIFWLVFGICQISGAILPRFANFHSNLGPLLLGIVLLLPGSILAVTFGNLDAGLQTILLFSFNFVAWYSIRKLSLKEKQMRAS
jgi:uncharacterized membrane protein HdeD (DUF308 family)